MPHLVAGREDHALMLRRHLPAAGIDVSDTSDVLDPPFLSVRDVAVLELSESTGERELSVVIERLTGKQDEGVLLHGQLDRREPLVIQSFGKVHAEHFYAEIDMQRPEIEFHLD